jgi:hypothetical protein
VRLNVFPAALVSLAFAAACSSTGSTSKPVDCSAAPLTNLQVGEHTIIDASAEGCVRLPSAGAGGAEYLYVALATEGKETGNGVSVGYKLTGSGAGFPLQASRQGRRPLLRALQAPTSAQAFHGRLRTMERELAKAPRRGLQGFSASAAAQPAPVLGEQRTFNVLKNSTVSGTSATDYVQVTGTTKYVGQHVAIFLDDAAPTPGYTQADIDKVGSTFDKHLYPIDVAAFGSESDINGDGVVLVLLTDRVTKLTSCGTSVVVGYFFARDLTPGLAGSNGAEIFYGLTPDPSCGIPPADAVDFLPRVFIHEFQHMINYNQHVLVRGGSSEATWLNEGLSTFAEELGGRQIPDSVCTNNDCLTQFTLNDLENGSDYLSDVESHYLVGPRDRPPPIPLAEYGAAWLFVRWVADHFGQPLPLGTSATLGLVQTSNVGSDNVTAVTGVPFSTLVGQWQMANYLDNLPGFTPSDPRLQYLSWDLRQTYDSINVAYPLDPDSTDGPYSRTGQLLAGSGPHVLIGQAPSLGEVDFKLTASDGTLTLPESPKPRIGLVRIH